METKSDFEKQVREYAREFGGFLNAHVHGDRAFTYNNEFYRNIGRNVSELDKLTLREKQSLVWAVHKGKAFHPECIEERMRRLIEDSIKYGVTRLDTTVDVTHNTRFVSFEIADKLKKEYSGKIGIKIGAYNVSGFKDSAPERFKIFEEAAQRADFLVALAEKDRKPGHIGERQHNAYMLNLSLKLNKPVHFHADQANVPEEHVTSALLEDMDYFFDVMHRTKTHPQISVVHFISPSCYSEEDFSKLCDGLLKHDLSVICCPNAGISMKQERSKSAPVHNSLARVWDLALKEIPVYLGTDNVNDIFVPASSPDVFDEVNNLANILRFYNPRVLAKVACGEKLDDFDRGTIRRAFS